MKTIMKIMLVLAIVSVSVMEMKAQYLAEMPSAGFQSTSSAMVNSGSPYQSAAVSGFVSADDYYENTTRGHRGTARRGERPGQGGEEEGGPEGGDRPGPYENPIGEGLWVLLAMAAGAALFRRRRKASGLVH